MEIRVTQGNVVEHATPALVVNLFEGVKVPGGATGAVDQALGGLITRLIESGEITGAIDEITVIHTSALTSSTDKPLAAERVLVVGLGKTDKFNYERVRSVSAQAARKLRALKVKKASTIVHGAGVGGLEAAGSAEAIAEGSLLGLYTFTKYKSVKNREDSDATANRNSTLPELLELIELDAGKTSAIETGIARGISYAKGTNLARDLVNEPPNVLSPSELAVRAAAMCKDATLDIEVLQKADCEKLGMGSYLAVAEGSVEPPKFIHISYKGDSSKPENNIWLVGKGITFDSGGLSLKPAASMVTMKGDMGGGAAVIGAMQVIAALKPKINVHAVCAATENMPSGSAARPGDVVKAMNGKFIEIENTDAEGRLTLADAICYAKGKGAARIIDVATLTGAVSVALGKGHMGAFSNNNELFKEFEKASSERGEPVWRLPLISATKRLNTSQIADMKNTGGRAAGSITAAHFIHEFAEDTPWVHLDMAAFNMSDDVAGVNVRGATGASTRLLARLVENLAG